MDWYDWHTVTERLQGRSYALTRGRPYKVTLDPATQTGTCDFTNKRILINPNLFDDVFRAQGLSGRKLDEANFLVSRAVTGHETLHVLYSDPKIVVEAAQESPVIKTVLNLLEDARIERIGSESSHVSRSLFRFVNGIARMLLPDFTDTGLRSSASVVQLLLRWRLGADIPKLEQPAEQLWERAKALANTAIHAADCEQVLSVAREIVKVAGLGQSSAKDPAADPLIERMESNMMGERDSSPLSNPLPPADQPRSNDNTPADGIDADSANGEPREEQMEEDVDDPESGQSGAISGGNSQCEDDSNDHSDAEDNPDESVHSVNSEDIERLVEETARQVSEDLGSLVPPDSDQDLLVARSTPYRGRCYSDIVATPYVGYLPRVIPIAAEITRELKAEGPKAISGPSDSPGRFRARYYIRDSSHPFAAKRFQGLSVPKMALSLILDRSGSMEHIVEELKVMAMAISAACENLRIPLSIWALEGQVHIKHFDEHGPQVLAKLAGIRADTLTRTMPTIRDAVAELQSRPEELKQIVLVHDGMPSDRQDFIEWRTALQGINLFCLFIMREEDYPAYQENPQQLREYMDEIVGPQNYAIAPVTSIVRHWCSFIRNLRNRHSVPAL